MNFNCICLNCMKEKPAYGVRCPYCDFFEEEVAQDRQHLEYYSVLKGKYLVGKALGQGGFGITYVGLDMNLELKVAIKEYYPDGYAVRDHKVSNKIQLTDDNGMLMREQERFLEEARILAQCEELSGIVRVRDYFKENNTTYIVMEYVEGETLLSYMKKRGGKLEPFLVFSMMKPAIKSLIQIHEQGVVHKDISPDNIMITTKNTVKLIDFGSADRGKETGAYNTYKKRYSPLEQRSNDMKVGSYSDIYAFCATMYYAMTGQAPQDVTERMKEDKLVPPSQLGIDITPVQEAALMKGLEIQPKDRIHDAKELYYFLYQFGQIEEHSDALSRSIEKEKTDELMEKFKERSELKKIKKWQVAVIIVAVAVFALYIIIRGIGMSEQRQELEASPKMRTEFVEEAGKAENDELRAMAEEFAETLEDVKRNDLKEGWDEVYQEALQDVIDKYGENDCAWMVIPISEECDAEDVLEKGLSNASNAESFASCSEIGVAVVDSELGYIFYVVFMK